MKIAEDITFYKNSPIFFEIYFILTLIPFVLRLIALVLHSLFELSFPGLSFLAIILGIFVSLISWLLIQIPEVIYFALMANRHIKYIDCMLAEINMNR